MVNEIEPDRCLICESIALEEMPEFPLLVRITSDCRPFRNGGRLAVCRSCGAVQKYPDSHWLNEIAEIYSGYAAYYQADGDEQIILDSRSGSVRRRSDVILERLIETKSLPETGRVLDIGCGSGVTLSAVSKTLPSWELYGQDMDKRNKIRLDAIPGFVNIFDCAPGEIEGQYDLITLIHSLEHFQSPGALLKSLLSKLSPVGILLVQVCNTVQNPYDLLIADHLMHFSADTLQLLAENSGFKVKAVETEWVTKELSMIASNSTLSRKVKLAHSTTKKMETITLVSKQLRWLVAMVQEAKSKASDSDSFGIFGTSICATWLAGILGERIAFFVDEDPSRQGKDHMGKPVFRPQQVPIHSTVYMALVPEIAARVRERIRSFQFQLILPPSFDAVWNIR